MLRTLPPRSAGGGPGHAQLLAGLHDRPPPLRLQVEPHALSPGPQARSQKNLLRPEVEPLVGGSMLKCSEPEKVYTECERTLSVCLRACTTARRCVAHRQASGSPSAWLELAPSRAGPSGAPKCVVISKGLPVYSKHGA